MINICLTCQETGRATQKDTKEIPPETYEKALYNQKIIIIINTTPYLLKLQNSCIHNYPEPTTNFKSFCTTIDFFPPINSYTLWLEKQLPLQARGRKVRPQTRGAQPHQERQRWANPAPVPWSAPTPPPHTTSHLLKLMNHERKMMISFRNYQY